MQGLPSMVYGDGISKKQQIQFGGYNHNLGAGDGEIWDMENLTSDYYPLLAPRKKRSKVLEAEVPGNGIFFADSKETGERHLYLVHGNVLSRVAGAAGLEKVGDLPLENVDRIFAPLGNYIMILPDKVAWNTETDTIEAMEASITGEATIGDGTYEGEAAEANTVTMAGAGDLFKVGDAVTFSGFTLPENNKTIIIREIEGNSLRFYENSFSKIDGDAITRTITIKRTVPDMDFICENENRLWGCKGNTIYASKLGDPFNWNVFDGLSTDSFAADTGSAGDFTGCISYMGYPCFFKEDHIYKVYGDRPANFQVMGSASLGVAKGSGKSLAVAGETLFYLSRVGIVAYTGGIPQSVAAPFGDVKYKNAVAGSDGVKYFVCMTAEDGGSELFVFDTGKNMWHKETGYMAKTTFAFDARTLVWIEQCKVTTITMLPSGPVTTEKDVCEIWQYGNRGYPDITPEEEGDIESFAEFGDFVEGGPNRKGVSKLQLRVELAEGSSFAVHIQFDSDGEWRLVKRLVADRKKSFYLPIIPRRCDHYRIKIEGEGDWKLHSMVRETYSGSEM